MHPRAAFRISFVAGLLVLAVTLLGATQEPVRPCGNLPQNYAPIIAFELARSDADLEAIFGPHGSLLGLCGAQAVAKLDAINLVDVLVYIPAYGVFMAFFFLGMRARNAALGTLGLRVSIVAALGDFAENACLMTLTPTLDPSSTSFAVLPWATGVKWLGLGVAGAIAAAIYVKSTGARLGLRRGVAVCRGISQHRRGDRRARPVRTDHQRRRWLELAGVSHRQRNWLDPDELIWHSKLGDGP